MLKELSVVQLLHEVLLLSVCVQADKLLSQDFKNMLDDIISFLPRERQVLLYSATFPMTVEEFVVRYLCIAAELPSSSL